MAEFEKYYEEEMRYLREGGKEFAEAFPEKARFLNIDAVEDRDPYVERLFEGFAFLTGRIRQKLDDEFPEFTQNLMEMVDPSFLRGIPSLCMLEFGFRPAMMPNTYVVPRGSVMLSAPVGPEHITCRFGTTRDVSVHPFTMTGFEFFHDPISGDGMEFVFEWDESADPDALDLEALPIYVHGERSLAYSIIFQLTHNVKRATVEGSGGKAELKAAHFKPGGFDEADELFPQKDNSFEACRFLKEYFAFDEKFRYVHIHGMDCLRRVVGPGLFRLKIYLDKSLPEGLRAGLENFRLYATPIVNLFEDQAVPVNLDHRHFEYRLRADAGTDSEIWEVQDIEGSDKATGKTKAYYRFSDFRRKIADHGERASGDFYQVRQENIGRGKFSTYVSIGSHGNVEQFSEEFLSIRILATNGGLPRQEITEDSVTNPHGDFPTFCFFKNFTRPTAPIPPPRSDHYLWNVLSHMNMNYRSLCQEGNLNEILSLYNWSHTGGNQKIIESVMGCTVEKKGFLMGSQMVRGSELTVKLRDGTFSGLGEQLVFGRVLLEFFTQYSTLNHLVSLKMVNLPSGQTHEWEPLEGKCHLI